MYWNMVYFIFLDVTDNNKLEHFFCQINRINTAPLLSLGDPSSQQNAPNPHNQVLFVQYPHKIPELKIATLISGLRKLPIRRIKLRKYR